MDYTEKNNIEIKRDYSARVYTREEFIEICKKVGFKRFEVYSDWTKTDYQLNSEEMIIVSYK
ncbi:MAG: hypothetical protein ABIC36_02855 [bacterium]